MMTKFQTRFFIFVCVSVFSAISSANAQVIVGEKNISADKDIEYIQLLYYLDKSSFEPVYLIDYGIVASAQEPLKTQKIEIDKQVVDQTMSPMRVINLLHKAGWEYMGDKTFVKAPMVEGWYSFTLRRKR